MNYSLSVSQDMPTNSHDEFWADGRREARGREVKGWIEEEMEEIMKGRGREMRSWDGGESKGKGEGQAWKRKQREVMDLISA